MIESTGTAMFVTIDGSDRARMLLRSSRLLSEEGFDVSTSYFILELASGFLSAHAVPAQIEDEEQVHYHAQSLIESHGHIGSIFKSCEASKGREHTEECAAGYKTGGNQRTAVAACVVDLLVAAAGAHEP